MIPAIKIGEKFIGSNYSPFIIAEMSGNHNQSLQQALAIVDAAAACGVQALKIQTYTADTMTLDLYGQDFYIDDPQSLWQGTSLYKLYSQAHTPWEWHTAIFNRCREVGLIGFSTPFDETAVDFLESLDVPCYKIASFENNHLPLIKKVAATGKPMIMSTGMADVSDINEAVSAARSAGCDNLILLKCTSSYPASPAESNILTIPHMGSLFECQVGLSDHTAGIGAAVASVALGATVIEKHFTLDRSAGGVDAAFSLEPHELKALRVESERAWQALGQISYKIGEKEAKSLKFKRSLYVAEDIKQGEVFTADNLRIIRPGFGLAPKYYDIVLGKTAKADLAKGKALTWNDIG